MTKQRETAESRPPLYNSEDYIAALKRFSRLTGLQMYLSDDGSFDGPATSNGNEKGAEEKGGNKNAKSAKSDAATATSAATATGAGLARQDLDRTCSRFPRYVFQN